MARFLLGLLLGAALVGLPWWLSASPSSAPLLAPPPPEPPEPPEPPDASSPALLLEAAPASSPSHSRAPTRTRGAAHHGLAVQVGDGVDLVGWRVVSRSDPDADLECLDLQSHSALFAARHGGRPLRRAVRGTVFAELDVEEARRRARHAPLTLEPADVWISAGSSVNANTHPLGQVAASDGSAFLLWIEALDFASSALDRRVWLLAERIERSEAGSTLDDAERLVAAQGPGLERATQLRAWGAVLPGFPTSTARDFEGDWQRLEDAWGHGRMQGFHRRLELPEPWHRALETGPWLSLYLPQGTTDAAKVTLDHHSTVLHVGDQRGEAQVQDHATLIVEGDLLGRVTVVNHGVLFLQGRVRGTLKVGPWARVVLLQGAGGTLDLTTCSEAHLLLGGELRRDDIASLGHPGLGCVLHLERSDLASGSHEALLGWQQVTVADERWNTLRR